MGGKRLVAAFLLVASGAVLGWGVAQSAATPELTPQDHVEIQELYATYARAYDSNEANGEVWAETFTEDGVFTFGERRAVGHKELAAYSNSRPQTGPKIQHWTNGLIIQPTPEGAAASMYVMVITEGAGATPPTMPIVTTYTDRLVRTPQGWRIKSRAGGLDLPPLRP